MRDLTILMDHTRGRPADLLEAIGRRGATVRAGCLFSRIEERVAHMAVDDADIAAVGEAAMETGCVLVDDRECVVVPAGYEGGMAAIGRRIADAGATVNVVYYGAGGELFIGTTDLDTTRKALGLD